MSFKYESVAGHFEHDNASEPLVAVPDRFGLKDSSDQRWQNLFKHIHALNQEAPDNTFYKIFLLSRHGQGYHNLAEAKYGTKAWDEHWSKLDTDGELLWGPDPLLTPLGREQGGDIRAVWKKEALVGLPPPHKRYCSPLARALDTCDIMLDQVFDAHPHPVLIIENCREENGVHTCDKRQTRSYIADYKPHFSFEEDFSEHDELWHPTIRETKPEVARRAQAVLDRVFEKDTEDIFISITAHSGWINGFLTAIGREHFRLPTGGVMPVLMKASLKCE
ncbi:phosphoglycerate mutase [Pholiota conissans]|uniref:Phosphoglycerate mutase n=1 Tax=Pholiota conissans TaxID=109636 RepID=A0A9P5ZD96_9AGAR|nr:phosphoglycerate mutase [Pholiota conissans]